MTHPDRKRPVYEWNPFEVAFCGHSGSGKTTLIEKCIRHFSRERRVAYLKHDAHRFEMDVKGKDTWRAAEAGASCRGINSADASAVLTAGEGGDEAWRAFALQHDLLLVEGYKQSPLPKLVFEDPGGEMLRGIREGRLTNVMALISGGSRPAAMPGTGLPRFGRDDLGSVLECIEAGWKAAVAPLRALVLGGGRSTRMGEDKSELRYHDRPHALWLMDLCESLGIPASLSLRPDQAHELEESRIVRDTFLGLGPLGGILSALVAGPRCAWLVLSCDLPFVTEAAIRELLAARDPFRFATAFHNAEKGWPEPLLTVYEPKFLPRVLGFLGRGHVCPRKVLINSRIASLQPGDPDWLFNANNPEERRRAERRLTGKENA